MGTILKGLLFAVIGYLLIGIVMSFKQVKKMQEQSMEEYQAKQEKFKHITEELLNETSDEELREGILMHIFNKEDEDFENLKSNLTAGELVVYTLYQMEIAVEQGRGSVHRFFDGPSKVYASDLVESYKAVGCPKLSDLMGKVIDLIFKEETGMYNEIDIEEDAPSFQGYTFDYMDYVADEELEEKTIAYIREHKELFIN